jgi:hypothetical protein
MVILIWREILTKPKINEPFSSLSGKTDVTLLTYQKCNFLWKLEL